MKVNIDKGNHQKRCNKNIINRHFRCQAEFEKQGGGHQAADGFDQGIAKGYGCFAETAFSPEDQITENRNIVVKGDFSAALGAR